MLAQRTQSRIDQATRENQMEIGITHAVEDQSESISGERTNKLAGGKGLGQVPFLPQNAYTRKGYTAPPPRV